MTLTASKTKTTLKKIVRRLKQRIPLKHPAALMVDYLGKNVFGKCEGLASEHGRMYIITVAPHLTELELETVVIHEWAHALDLEKFLSSRKNVKPPKEEHGDSWALCYGKVFRAFYKRGKSL